MIAIPAPDLGFAVGVLVGAVVLVLALGVVLSWLVGKA
jgi:hypothetical protein